MSILKFLLKRKLLVGLVVVLIFIIGLYATTQLDQELMPPVTFDGAVVEVDAGDMATLDVEERVTKPIEQVLQNIDGVTSVQSISSIGNSSMTIEMEEGRGDEVFKDVESSVKGLESQLPGVKSIMAFQYSMSGGYEFFMDISNGSQEEMSAFARDVVESRLEALPEVRDVDLVGLEEKEVIIKLKEDKLTEYAIDPAQIIGAMQQANMDVSVGQLSGEDQNPTIRWNTSFETVEDIKNVTIPTMEGIKKISDIATVTEQTSELSSGVWKNGSQDFILVQIGRVSTYTQVDMAKAVRAEVEKIREEGLVSGFEFEEIVTQADYVSDSIEGVSQNVLIGGVLAILVLLLFLRNLRATVIIGLSIPLSILLTFTGMWYFEYSFNMLSLIALGLGIGMMVDASIVILESIYRKKEQGYENLESVLQGVKEVATAVFASMLTTIVVFLPIGILGGEAGKFMIILSVVVCVTLISSVIVSFTLIPTLSENFLKLSAKAKNRKEGKVSKGYGGLVSWIGKKKRNRYSVILSFLVIFIVSVAVLAPKVPMTLMPDVLNRYAEVGIMLESGVTPAQRQEIAIEVNERLETVPDVTNNFVLDMVGTMYVIINMAPEEEATIDQKEVNEKILATLLELEETHPVDSVNTAMNMGGGSPIQIQVAGDDLEQLSLLSEEVSQELASIDGIIGVKNPAEKQITEQQIVLKEKAIKDANLTPTQLYGVMESYFTNVPVGQMVSENTVPIVVTNDIDITKKSDFLERKVMTPSGEEEKLSKYVELKEVQAPTEINRKDGDRYVTISANIEGRDLGAINRDIQSMLNDFDSPAGYSVSTAGDLEAQQKAAMEMVMVLGIALFLVYVVMAVQFNSLKHPIIVMSVIPLTVTGVILGLLLTQRELSIMSGMGVIMLIGIVLNNAILLIDRTNQLRKEDMDVASAVVEAGKNRLRPIFMTTLTTVGGMLPLAISTGAASNYQAPLATVVISGLLFATLITLVIIPSVYLLFEDISRGLGKIKGLFKRKKKIQEVDSEVEIQQ
ncbi:efflux RND transporter permease subunit [Bacillus alkalicellulosilyticus]|uniref:efflux RND transporter permease subunit n=1 Tax=Alkalihalobacterium alkalicellulosilyticum TaxID=1912214 RepID=UPI000996B009|nr:efflux RND transporter permease subunit [Bacillus alkalicellulosilyticus]